MWATEKSFHLDKLPADGNWLNAISRSINSQLGPDEAILRFVVPESSRSRLTVEALILHQAEACGFPTRANFFACIERPFENTSSFNVALIVPTGIGAEIGGHAGDAGPVVKLLASIFDTVIMHPNVVNASDINEMPENSLYVEGSVLSRLFLGQIGLQRPRQNRILVVIDDHEEYFTNAVTNSVNAARATYGLHCAQIIQLKPGIRLNANFSESGRAGGEVSNFEPLLEILKRSRGDYDAIAISSIINVPPGYHQKYFDAQGAMVNPWGGVEAMLTHTISTLMNVPSAHAPMMETREIANADSGIVDPRMAAEAISFTYLQCVLKGLQQSPRIFEVRELGRDGLFDVTNISCLIIPDGCVGIPTLAALVQNIPVIAVRENRNLMKNDLSLLPWREGQLSVVENYWEAAGVAAAIKAGIEPRSVRRPITMAKHSNVEVEVDLHSISERKQQNESASAIIAGAD